MALKAMPNGDEDTPDEIYVDSEDGGYIEVHGGDGCRSYVGKIPLPSGYSMPQNITLGRKCETIGTAAHELAHALGLIHTHERPDRDDYITVNESNIEKGTRTNSKRSPIEAMPTI
ncbi:astacin, partial [Ostertagia ostertagi]